MKTAREVHLQSIIDDIDVELDAIIDKLCHDPLYKLSPLQAKLFSDFLTLYKDQVDTMYEIAYTRLGMVHTVE